MVILLKKIFHSQKSYADTFVEQKTVYRLENIHANFILIYHKSRTIDAISSISILSRDRIPIPLIISFYERLYRGILYQIQVEPS